MPVETIMRFLGGVVGFGDRCAAYFTDYCRERLLHPTFKGAVSSAHGSRRSLGLSVRAGLKAELRGVLRHSITADQNPGATDRNARGEWLGRNGIRKDGMHTVKPSPDQIPIAVCVRVVGDQRLSCNRRSK